MPEPDLDAIRNRAATVYATGHGPDGDDDGCPTCVLAGGDVPALLARVAELDDLAKEHYEESERQFVAAVAQRARADAAEARVAELGAALDNADDLVGGREIDPAAANAAIANRFRRLLDLRTTELTEALGRIAELEALLVQAEDYAREQGEDFGRAVADLERDIQRLLKRPRLIDWHKTQAELAGLREAFARVGELRPDQPPPDDLELDVWLIGWRDALGAVADALGVQCDCGEEGQYPDCWPGYESPCSCVCHRASKTLDRLEPAGEVASSRASNATTDPLAADRGADEASSSTARRCCDLHGRHCEPPGDLCCADCAEVNHPQHPPGVECVLGHRPTCRLPMSSCGGCAEREASEWR